MVGACFAMKEGLQQTRQQDGDVDENYTKPSRQQIIDNLVNR